MSDYQACDPKKAIVELIERSLLIDQLKTVVAAQEAVERLFAAVEQFARLESVHRSTCAAYPDELTEMTTNPPASLMDDHHRQMVAQWRDLLAEKATALSDRLSTTTGTDAQGVAHA